VFLDFLGPQPIAILDMAAFFKLALRIHKLCHILLSGDSHRESRSGVDYAVYADDVLLHRPPLHFQKTYKNVADAKTTSATSAAIFRGHLHTICIVAAGRCRTAPDDTRRCRPVPCGTASSGAVRCRTQCEQAFKYPLGPELN